MKEDIIKPIPLANRINIFIVFCVAIGGLLYGYSIGATSGLLIYINKEIAMTAAQKSFYAATFFWGGALAMIVTGFLADLIGRKKMMFLSSLLFIIGIFVIVSAKTYSSLVISSSIIGVAIGILTIVIPLYISESMPAAMRGRGTLSFQLLLTFGILAGTVVALLFQHTQNWRGIYLTELIPGVILLIVSLIMHESPRWLYSKKSKELALKVLYKTRTKAEAEAEISEMDSNSNKKESKGRINLLQKKYLLPLGLAIGVMILNQLTGINSILQYNADILQNSGLSSSGAALVGGTFITGVNFIMTIIAMILVDKIERKKLLCFGTGGVVICLLIAGCVYLFFPQSSLKGIIVLISLIGFIIFFAIGPGSLCWVVASEVLPTRLRSTGLSVALFLNSIAGALLSSVFLPLQTSIGFGGIFLFCAICTVIYFVIGLSLPSMKGKSLEEIERQFEQRSEGIIDDEDTVIA